MSSRRDPEEKRRVADTLRALRVAAGVTQEEAAARVNLTLSGYRTYEQGKRTLRADQIPMFAEAFDVPASAITSRLWPNLAAEGVSDLAEQLAAIGFRPDEAPPFAEFARDVAQCTPRQRAQILDLLRTAVDLARN